MEKKKSDNTITIKDIASICGVSISTVSNVLNGKTKKVSQAVADKIMDTVEKTGYMPNYLAKNLRASSTKTIGVIAEDLILFSTTPMIEGLMQRCEEKGYNVVIENMRLFGRWDDKWMHDEALFQSALAPIMNKMEALNVDGVVYIAGYEHKVSLNYKSDKVPLVFVYATNNDKDIPCFRLDDEDGGYIAYKYLQSKGHKKIGIIAGEPENPHTVNRLRGIQRAMFEEGTLFDPSMVQYQTWNKQGGYNGMEALKDKDITAVFCLSDLIASGVYEYMLQHGKEPGKDLSIMGYDNHEVSALLYPSLSTVALALEKMGYEAVSRLIRSCEKEDIESDSISDVRIAGEIIERDSVIDITNSL